MNRNDLPNFNEIDTDQILPKLNHLIDTARSSLRDTLKRKSFTYDSLVALREEIEDDINKFWSPISQLQAVCNEDALREVYAKGLLEITKLQTEMDQDSELLVAYEEIKNSSAFSELSIPKQKAITNAIKDFYLAGVNPLMCEVAGRVADGFHVHPMHTVGFLTDMILPNIRKGLNDSENPLRHFELYAPIFVITGANDKDKTKMEKSVRQQIAFYGSTPNYASLFSYHGYHELGKKLNISLKRGETARMGNLIPDELLEQIAIIDHPENVAKRIAERYIGILDRCSLYCSLDSEHVSNLLIDLPTKIRKLLAVNND